MAGNAPAGHAAGWRAVDSVGHGMSRRKKATAGTLPPTLVEWFSGERVKVPWVALAFPGGLLLPERWRAWAAANPGARPPPGWQWLADPTHPRHRAYPPALASARRVAK